MAKSEGATLAPGTVFPGEPQEGFNAAPYREFAQRAERGEPVALVTIIGAGGSTPRGLGACMTVRPDGSIVGTVGGGNLELYVIEHAQQAMRDGRPRRIHFDFTGTGAQNVEKACLGQTDFFVQPAPPPHRLYVFGAGHVAAALTPMAIAVGFWVTVLDDREGYPDGARFPPEAQLRCGPFPELIEQLTFDEQVYLAIMTYGHSQDEAVLRACLPRTWRYLGMMGSRAKVAAAFDRVGTDERLRDRLSRVHAPIGLTLGGRTPGEIAVSIVAELLTVRHGREEIASMRGA